MKHHPYTFSLSLPGLPELGGDVRGFLRSAIEFAGFSRADTAEMVEKTCGLIGCLEQAIEVEGDVALPLDIAVAITPDQVVISIVEHGIPMAEEDLEARQDRMRVEVEGVFDDHRWEQDGMEGTKVVLARTRPHPDIPLAETIQNRRSAHDHDQAEFEAGGKANPAEYTIRTFHEHDALAISRLFYRCYGRTYPNPDVYLPERLVELNASGHLLSVVSETADGAVCGHYAIERPNLELIGETGLAVVGPAHRGCGLMGRMRDLLHAEGARLDLRGLWCQPTTRHPYSQRTDLAHGTTPCALLLGTTPPETHLKKLAEDGSNLRHSCLIHWLPLAEESEIVVSVPDRLWPVTEAIYRQRGRNLVRHAPTGPPTNDADASVIRTRIDPVRRLGWIEVPGEIDQTTKSRIIDAVDLLHQAGNVDVAYVDLPITSVHCAWLADELLSAGKLVFAGIGPHFESEDVLRLQRPYAAVDLDGLVLEGDLARMIGDMVIETIRG